MKLVYLGLGSNLGDREQHLREALARLEARELRILRTSPVYETEPVGGPAQECYLNLVVEAETELLPLQLLARTARIERMLGRVRTVRNGPRTIDIDILLYGRARITAPQLEVPHPRMAERRFVLAPLADLAPNLRHPATHLTVSRMLREAPEQGVRLFGRLGEAAKPGDGRE
jgi:2-amino-4-hydroxy-6-hydroxymethyldihydropteridine diphosphokinase